MRNKGVAQEPTKAQQNSLTVKSNRNNVVGMAFRSIYIKGGGGNIPGQRLRVNSNSNSILWDGLSHSIVTSWKSRQCLK